MVTSNSNINWNNLRTNSKTTKSRKAKCEEKQLYRYFKRQTKKIAHEMLWIGLSRGNFKSETASLLIVAQNDVIRTRDVKAKIVNTWKNRKHWLCGDRVETVDHIISECS